MAVINKVYGQSNFDVSLQAYGSLDRIVKLCKDNGINNITTGEVKKYSYDPNLIVNRNYVGYKYGTKASPSRIFNTIFNIVFG